MTEAPMAERLGSGLGMKVPNTAQAGSTPARCIARGEKAAQAAMDAERMADAVRDLDALHRDKAAIDRVLAIIGWLW